MTVAPEAHPGLSVNPLRGVAVRLEPAREGHREAGGVRRAKQLFGTRDRDYLDRVRLTPAQQKPAGSRDFYDAPVEQP